MSRTALHFLLAAAICAGAFSDVFAGSGAFVTAVNATASASELQILDRVNRQRERSGLGDLAWDDRLAQVAREYSVKMAREQFFDHYDQRGETVVDRVGHARIGGWRAIGENLFVCENVRYGLADFTVAGWMKSPTHRTNMLDPKWTSTGIGIAQARDGSVYITEVFIQD
jgi:uncharacterized protein YkwD